MASRVLKGVVVGDKADKTISVLINRRAKHKRYHKMITLSKKYAVHDESNVAKLGDIVSITESKPISKSKKWKLLNS